MKGRKHLRANDQLITNGQHNKRETECISSRYSNEFELRWRWRERKRRKGKGNWRRHGNALDQEQKKKKRNKETKKNKVWLKKKQCSK